LRRESWQGSTLQYGGTTQLSTRLGTDPGGTLAAASRTDTERINHAAPCYQARHPANAIVGSDPGTGFTQTVFVYPMRLVYQSTDHLRAPEGDSRRHLGGLRTCVASAFGIGEGPTEASQVLAGSARGRVVRLAPLPAAALSVSHGVVVTQHAYSARRRQQIVIPLLPAGTSIDASDVAVIEADWINGFTVIVGGQAVDLSNGAVLPISLMTSVNQHEGDIDLEEERVLDEATLQRVDAEIVSRYRLPRARLLSAVAAASHAECVFRLMSITRFG